MKLSIDLDCHLSVSALYGYTQHKSQINLNQFCSTTQCFLLSSGGSDRDSSMGYLQEARENHVKKKVEEALRSKMKEKALKQCDYYALKYAECASGRTLSVVWQCRNQARELNDCLHQFTNDAVLEEMKREYMLQQEGKASAGI